MMPRDSSTPSLRRSALLAVRVSALIAAAGGHTTAGFGRDVEKLGSEIEEAAEEERGY